MTIEVREYRSADGRRPFAEWVAGLRDPRANQRIVARVLRMQAGNRGDCKSVGAGVFELRIDYGPGHRVYCGRTRRGDAGAAAVRRRQANTGKDIEQAHDYWKDYKARR